MTDLQILKAVLMEIPKFKDFNWDSGKLPIDPITFEELNDKNGYVLKNDNLISLNLDKLEITALPNKISQLQYLTRLDLRSNQLTALPPEIAQLSKLILLDLNSNQLTNLPPEITQLSKLTELDLRSNQLTNLPPEITQLSNLNYLDLSENQLTALPPEIGQLSKLTQLNLRLNQLTALPPEIAQLSNLTRLDLRLNQLIALLPEIAQLSNLTELDLRSNQLTALPPEIAQLSKLTLLDLWLNQFEFEIPNHIYQKSPQEQIRFLLELQEQGAAPLNEGKMILLGNGAVGKTALVERLVNGTFSGKTEMTEGIAITAWEIEEVTLNIWDFGGQEIMRAMHQFFMTPRTLYVLVAMYRTDDSGTPLEDWLQLIATFGGDSPVLIVVSKFDVHDLNIDENRLQDEYPNIVGFYRTSAKHNTGIDDLRTAIEGQLTCTALKHIRDDIPKNWFKIKEELVPLQQQRNYISLKEYHDLCNKHRLTDEQKIKDLLKLLRDLGISFNYGTKDNPHDTNILKPEWVTQGIYAIINNNDFFQQGGKITIPQVGQLLRKVGDYHNKERVIIGLMERFDLCFEIKKEAVYLVPDLLPKRQPFIGNMFEDGLKLVYEYEFLPLSVMPQFITKVNDLAEGYWLHGVIIKNEKNNTALIRVNYAKKRITIAVIGTNATRRILLTRIRTAFNALHQRFSEDFEPEIKVPVIGHTDKYVDYELLEEALLEGDDYLRVKGVKDKINVRQHLVSIETESEVEKIENSLSVILKKDRRGAEKEAFMKRTRRITVLEKEIAASETTLNTENQQLATCKTTAKRWKDIAHFLYWLAFGLIALFLTIFVITPNWDVIEPATLLFGVVVTFAIFFVPKQVLPLLEQFIFDKACQKIGVSDNGIKTQTNKLNNLQEELKTLQRQQ